MIKKLSCAVVTISVLIGSASAFAKQWDMHSFMLDFFNRANKIESTVPPQTEIYESAPEVVNPTATPDSDTVVNPVVIEPQTINSIYASLDGQIINLYNTNELSYLWLPAHTGEMVDLAGDMIITTAGGNDIILSNTTVSVKLVDLVGEEMQAGKKYIISAKDRGGNKQPDIAIMKADNISTIFINSDKTVEELHVSKNVAGAGSISMIKADGVAVNNDTSLKRIKGRGNSTWLQSGDKRPYNIKLDKKQELIAGAGAAKDWCLISDNCQGEWVLSAPQFSTAAAYDMYAAIGGAYPISHEFINLYINGDYRGVYMITEKVEIDSERVNITETQYSVEDEESTVTVIRNGGVISKPQYWDDSMEENAVYLNPAEDIALSAGIQAYQYRPNSVIDGKSGGILLELDRGFQGEACWFITRNGYPYVLKEPEVATKEQVQNIAKYVQEYEDAVYSDTGYNSLGKYYTEYIDLDSMVKKLMVDLASSQTDTFVSSCYMSADVDEYGSFTKLVAGPAWDYDGSLYANPHSILYFDNNPTKQIIREFFEHGDFSARYAGLTRGPYSVIWDNEKNALLSYADNLANSYEMNRVLWNADGSNPRSCDFEGMMKDFSDRYKLYYSKFFADDKLLGVIVTTEDNKTLAASIVGTGTGYQWYKVNSEGKLEFIDGANGAEYTPSQPGAYGCAVSGITAAGMEVKTMYSNPVVMGYALTEAPEMAYIAEYDADGQFMEMRTALLTEWGTVPIDVDVTHSYKIFLMNSKMQFVGEVHQVNISH